jgi:hypothetical protein
MLTRLHLKPASNIELQMDRLTSDPCYPNMHLNLINSRTVTACNIEVREGAYHERIMITANVITYWNKHVLKLRSSGMQSRIVY